jgi:hypothetical protein
LVINQLFDNLPLCITNVYYPNNIGSVTSTQIKETKNLPKVMKKITNQLTPVTTQLTPVITCTQNACNSDVDLQGAMEHVDLQVAMEHAGNGEEKYRYSSKLCIRVWHPTTDLWVLCKSYPTTHPCDKKT